MTATATDTPIDVDSHVAKHNECCQLLVNSFTKSAEHHLRSARANFDAAANWIATFGSDRNQQARKYLTAARQDLLRAAAYKAKAAKSLSHKI